MNLEQFTTTELLVMHDEMCEGGKLDFLFNTGLVRDENDNLSEISIDQLKDGGLTQSEAEIFVCAVAASARSDWHTTQLAIYWAAQM